MTTRIEARLRLLEQRIRSSEPRSGYSAEFQAVLDTLDDERQVETVPAPTPGDELPIGCSARFRSVIELLSR